MEVFIHKISTFLAKGLGTGWIPFAPGTWGSVLGVALVYFLGNIWWTCAAVFIISYLVIWHYESAAKTHDESQVVIDEISGIFFTFLFASFPAGLVLYWVVNNSLSILQQWYITRKMEATDLVVVKKKR